MYMVTQLMSKSEKEKLQQTFIALDTNADGKLSREELIEGYREMHLDREQAVKEVDNIMANVDVDHNGYIDYSGSFPPNRRIFAGVDQQEADPIEGEPEEGFSALRQSTGKAKRRMEAGQSRPTK